MLLMKITMLIAGTNKMTFEDDNEDDDGDDDYDRLLLCKIRSHTGSKHSKGNRGLVFLTQWHIWNIIAEMMMMIMMSMMVNDIFRTLLRQ